MTLPPVSPTRRAILRSVRRSPAGSHLPTLARRAAGTPRRPPRWAEGQQIEGTETSGLAWSKTQPGARSQWAPEHHAKQLVGDLAPAVRATHARSPDRAEGQSIR